MQIVLRIVMWCALLWLLLGPVQTINAAREASIPRTIEHARTPAGVWFVPNGGQWADEARYAARVDGGDWWLTDTGWKVEMLGFGYDAIGRHEPPMGPLVSYVLDVRWEGCQPGITIAGSGREALHHISYYRGDDPTRWASKLKPNSKLSALEVWPGIKAVIDGERGDAAHIKCDWHVAAGADPGAISLRYEGLESTVQPDGSLKHFIGPRVGMGNEATGVWGHLIEAKPFAYQLNGTRLEEVECDYALEMLEDGAHRLRFILGEYDTARDLIIDPEIEFGSLVGSTADSWGFTAAYDDEGRLIGGSGVRDNGYPTTAGAVSSTFSGGDFDFGISVFSSDGSMLEYSTYLGGSQREYPHSLVTDETGDIYVMGTTGSQNFPTTSDAYGPDFVGGPFLDLGTYSFYGSYDNGCDIVVSKIDGVDGSLEASTFVGGTENDGINLGQKLNYNYGDVCRGEIVVDPAGAVWVASSSRSEDFPMVDAFDPGLSGPSDAVVFRLSNDLSNLEFSTYFGGESDDAAFAIQFSSSASLAYVTGGTKSNDLPTTPGAYQPDFAGDVDGYLFSIDYSGSPFLSTATYFGTDNYDQSYFVQLDTENRPHLCGQTVGSDMALVGDVYDANPNGSTFVVRFSENLETAEFVTRIGLPMTGVDISPTAFLVSDCDEMYISGWGGQTNSANSAYASQSTTNGMPTTAEAFQLSTDGSDFWLGVLAPDAVDLTYGTYFGGQFSEEHVDGGTSRFDKNGTVYQAVCAGCGGWDDFPTTAGAWSNTNDAGNCNLGVFKFNLGSLVADIEIEAPDLICSGDPIQFINNSIGGTNYEWFFGDLNSSDEENPEYIYATPGEWEIMLIVSDVSGTSGCLEPDTAIAYLFIEEIPQPLIDEIPPICEGESVNLQAYGTDALQWQAHPTLQNPTVSNPLVTPLETTTYTVEDSNECGAGTASVTVVVDVLQTEISPDMTICNGDVVELEAAGGSEVLWSPTTGLGSPTAATTTASPTETTTYTALISTPVGCIGEEDVTINVIQSAPGGQTYPTIYLCAGQGVFLEAMEGDSYLWSPQGAVTNPYSQNPYTAPSQNTTYYVSISNACGVGTDSVSVELVAPTASATGGGWMCRGETMELSSSDAVSYTWSPASLVADPNAQTTEVFPLETTTFTIYATDQYGCTGSSEITVYVWQAPYVDAGPNREVDWLEEVRLFGTVDADTLWWSPSENLSCSNCLTPEVYVTGPQWFVLESVSPEGCIGRDSTFIDVFYPLYTPNSFTPNNDGVNDAFFVEGVEKRGYRLEIYNRWGELLFYSEDPAEPWIGNHQVQDTEHFVPDGVYPWRLRFELRDGPRFVEGTVTLVR